MGNQKKYSDEEPWCPTVVGWMNRGWIDLEELKEHVKSCKRCQAIYHIVLEWLRGQMEEYDN